MRICLVAPSLAGRTGWDRYARGLVEAYVHAGHEVVVVCEKADAQVSVRQHAFLQDPLSYLVSPWRAYTAARKLRRLLADVRPDIVHIACEPYAALVRFMPRRYVVVLTVHGTYAYVPRVVRGVVKHLVSRWLFESAYRRARIVAVSSYTKRRLALFAPWIGQKSVSVIPNGVDFVRVAPPRAAHQVPMLLFVGAVKARKGVREILRGVAAYRRSYGNLDFLVLGSLEHEKGYVQEVQRLARELGLDSCVTWLGDATDEQLTRAYDQADVFAMLPQEGEEFEGFGLVYLEANMRGIPVIGARESAAEDAISQGESGFLVDAQDPSSFAHAVHAALQGGSALRESARRWAQKHTWHSIAEAYERVYAAEQS